jgi:multiple sugar transport system substrate-binding protein
VPTSYYWWGFFYRKSNFAKWGVQPPKTWDEFLALCKTFKGKGVAPIGIGAGGTRRGSPRLVRLPQHPDQRRRVPPRAARRAARFDDPKVKKVFTTWREVLPYFDPKAPRSRSRTRRPRCWPGQDRHVPDRHVLRRRRAEGRARRHRLLPVPDHRPGRAGRRGGADRRLLRQRQDPATTAGVKELLPTWRRRGAGVHLHQESSGTVLPATRRPSRPSTARWCQKGKASCSEAAEITQFFNRDSSDALQPTADTALTKFIDKPDQIDSILTDWQTAAQKVWQVLT